MSHNINHHQQIPHPIYRHHHHHQSTSSTGHHMRCTMQTSSNICSGFHTRKLSEFLFHSSSPVRASPSSKSRHLIGSLMSRSISITSESNTVPFNSVQQSHVTGPSKMPKSHVSHGHCCKVLNSSGDHMLDIEIFRRLRR